MDKHPGGRSLLSSNIGKDATTAFLGGVYEHSHAAHNVSPVESTPTGLEILTPSLTLVVGHDAGRRAVRRA